MRLKVAGEVGHNFLNVAVEVADFAGYGADVFGLVGGEMGEGLCAFGMLDLGRGLESSKIGAGGGEG